MMVRDLEGHYKKGVYICDYDGDGILEFSLDDVGDVKWVRAGRFLVEVNPSTGFNNGVLITISWTNP